MTLADFDFDLPEERIALRPAIPRDSARLLEVGVDGEPRDYTVADLPALLRPGDAMVFNDTRVIAARLQGRRVRDGASAAVEATLHKRLTPSCWAALMRPGKRLRPGDRIAFRRLSDPAEPPDILAATLTGKGPDGEVFLEFDIFGGALDDALARFGAMPLPPYIAGRRSEDDRDRLDYQTVYARAPGSVAAPTAGLHFTPQLLDRLAERGVSSHFVTLHVGAGTFLPVKTQSLADHRMHPEYGEVPLGVAEALNAVRKTQGRIVCVGTTSLRLLESATDSNGLIGPYAGDTRIFITPGYQFRAADGLMTNFHLPRSTLYMLVCAFSGRPAMRRAYDHAIAEKYRFYSYGDASLLWRNS